MLPRIGQAYAAPHRMGTGARVAYVRATQTSDVTWTLDVTYKKHRRAWLLLIVAATLYAWLIGLGSHAHGQLLPWLRQQQQPQACTGPGCPQPGQVSAQPFGAMFAPQSTFAQPATYTQPQQQQPAQQFPPPNPPRLQLPAHVQHAIVQIRGFLPTSADGSTMINVGTGVLVDKDENAGLIVTCAHIMEGATSYDVEFPSGQHFQGRVVSVDASADVSCIEISTPPPGAQPVELAEADPQIGAVVHSWGYGDTRTLAGNEGRVNDYCMPVGARELVWLDVTGSVRHGDSGSPIFDTSCRLSGVVHGTDGRRVTGARIGIVKRILGRLRRRFQGHDAPRQQQPQRRPDQQQQTPWRGTQAPPAPAQQGPLKTPKFELEPTPPLVDVAPPPVPDATAAAELKALRDKLTAAEADLKNARTKYASESASDWQARAKLVQEQKRLQQALDAATAAANAPVPKVEPGPGPSITTPTPPGPIAERVEGVAKQFGTAWLTTVLVGLGLPAGPAGVGASLATAAAVAAAGYWIRGRISNRMQAKTRARWRRATGGPSTDDEPATGNLVAAARKEMAEALARKGEPTATAAPDNYFMSSEYADDLAAKRVKHEGMTLGQEALLAQLYKEALMKFDAGHFKDKPDKAMAMESWVMGRFLQRHGVRTAMNSDVSIA